MTARWAEARGRAVRSSREHAAGLTEAVKRAVRGPGPHGPDMAVARLLAEALELAYAAGVREGEARSQSRAHRSLERWKRDVATLLERGLEPAVCPHCVKGRGPRADCRECSGTGKVQRP